jgi:hypothetical protein
MTLEAKRLIAFLFQRSGKKTLQAQEIFMTLSYELGWMTPAEAIKIIKQSLDFGLLEENQGVYSPTFDYYKVDIPLGFQIDGAVVVKTLTPELSGGVVTDIVAALVDAGWEMNYAQDQIRQTADCHAIIPDVAAVLVARWHNINVMSYIPQAWNAVKNFDSE